MVRCLSMISQFTIHMLVPICMCSYVGYLLDKKWNTDLMFILFFFIGALAGGRNVYRLAQKISGGKEKMPSKLYGSNKRKK
ncbi:MAG: AtpZ/AtpI family protein [Lachnospiraceae bacterium]|nr:AtpZ/AtpI family protein [Lachnospiraceae bacterium]